MPGTDVDALLQLADDGIATADGEVTGLLCHYSSRVRTVIDGEVVGRETAGLRNDGGDGLLVNLDFRGERR